MKPLIRSSWPSVGSACEKGPLNLRGLKKAQIVFIGVLDVIAGAGFLQLSVRPMAWRRLVTI